MIWLRPMRPLLASMLVAALSAGVFATGCGSHVGDAGSGARSGKLEVVAAENFWGSLAAQLGGERVRVHSIIVNPATDPHSYEPTAADARAMAGAQLAIVNGVGYDEWASRLLAASPLEGRAVLDVGSLLGLRAGANPHRWYYPSDVHAVVRQIVRDYGTLEPSARAYFAGRARMLETRSLARYNELLRELRERYAGVPVGYSESIFQGIGEYLGLKLLTPHSFAKAIAEGSEVTAQDKRTVDRQAETRQIAVWVFNSQNVTPDVQRAGELARAAGIPIATVTETLSPASASFEQWQVAQLTALRAALHEATGR
jgi:zinc/manganese transport system substrate-binding protein